LLQNLTSIWLRRSISFLHKYQFQLPFALFFRLDRYPNNHPRYFLTTARSNHGPKPHNTDPTTEYSKHIDFSRTEPKVRCDPYRLDLFVENKLNQCYNIQLGMITISNKISLLQTYQTNRDPIGFLDRFMKMSIRILTDDSNARNKSFPKSTYLAFTPMLIERDCVE
jgi:hypothetical protein